MDYQSAALIAAMNQGDLRFRAMADAAPVLIWETDENGVIFLNRHYLEFFGADFDTVRAMGWARFLHPDDAAGYEAAYRQAFSSREPYTYECRFRRSDGKYRWLRNSGRPVNDNRFVGCSIDVTDLQETQLALRVSEAHLQQILDTAATGLTRCSRDLRFLSANRAYAEIAGLPVDQIVGRTIVEVMGRDALQTIRPYLDRVLRGETVEYESEVPFRAGGPRFLHMVYTPWRERDGTVTGWVASVTDISARKLVEERQRALIEAIPQLVWSCDAEGRCDFLSSQWLEYTGLTLPQCLDYGWTAAVHEADRARLLDRWHEAVAGSSIYDVETRLRAADGSYRWFKVRGVPILDVRGHVRQWFGTSTDITDLVAAREADQKLAQQLRESDRRKDEFLAMLGHELRSPLAAIRNAGELLSRMGPWESGADTPLQVLHRQTKQLSRLLDDLLDIARITQGTLHLEDKSVPLDDVVDQAVESVQALVHEKSQQLLVSKPGVAPYVRGDQVRLVQVIANTLHNAAKYTDIGGQIELRLSASEDEITIAVRDNGMGISPEMLPRVFDAFAQDARTLARSQGGLGIGLSLVKRLIAMHHGTVQAESAGPGQGSTFTIRLPRVTPQQSCEDAPATPPRTTPRRILVVDDNSDAANSLAKLLRLEGHEVHAVHDALAALEMAEVVQPEVILLDIGLPQMDGYEVAQRIRKGVTAPIKLVALTGYGGEEHRKRAAAAGFDVYLVKPAGLEALRPVLSDE